MYAVERSSLSAGYLGSMIHSIIRMSFYEIDPKLFIKILVIYYQPSCVPESESYK